MIKKKFNYFGIRIVIYYKFEVVKVIQNRICQIKITGKKNYFYTLFFCYFVSTKRV